MVIDFSKIDLREPPVLTLNNTKGEAIGTLGAAIGVALDVKYNEASTLEFSLPYRVDGALVPFYDSVVGMRIVDVNDVGQFILMNPEETNDGVKKVKSCKGYSLEYEFTFKKITLEKATYNFWNPVAQGGTLLGAILELMPTWSVGQVDDTLCGKYRTFEVADTNLYNFIKSTVQQSYNCIFDFDTYNRTINVRDVSSVVPTNPIYISNANLAKEIKVTENTDNIVTRLDVNGAEGVDIRDVNPSGTNTLINLDYFMNTDNFDQDLIDKYYDWKDACSSYRQEYYNLSIEYSLAIMRRTTESAALTELENELVILENSQAVTLQAIAMNASSQSDLDKINAQIKAKQSEIDSKKADILSIQTQVDAIFARFKEINNETNFNSYFEPEELKLLDFYIKDDAVSESSFVATETNSYSSESIGNAITSSPIVITDSDITKVTNDSGKEIYDIRGGSITVDGFEAAVISAAMEIAVDGKMVMSAYLGEGTIEEGNSAKSFVKACLSIVGTASNTDHDLEKDTDTPGILIGNRISTTAGNGFLYFTYDVSEYEKRSVAWELLEYGEDILEKISQPSYTFSVTSANFLCLEDFTEFKNKLRHGEKIYVGISEEQTLSPICIGAQLNYDSIGDLSLEFSYTYTSDDSSFLLADLLEQSVSMGKNVDLSKYTYSAFIDSGASTQVRDFMNTALDVSKNAILSSKNQAITWNDSGIRLRKRDDDDPTIYDPKQVWMNNNSIMMTKDNWATAELAIGNFYDANLETECWGVVAPNIVGTLLAGENLVIESKKADGGKSAFRVDADGCVLYNSQFDIVSENKKTHIALDPRFGIAIGDYPVYGEKESAASMSAMVAMASSNTEIEVKEDNAKFWVDTDGNLMFRGKITATSGYIGGTTGWEIGSIAIFNGRDSLTSTAKGIYIGTDGISIGDGTNIVKATSDGVFTANNAIITGNITANGGKIGGFDIKNGAITYNGLTWDGNTDDGEDGGVHISSKGIRLGQNFYVDSLGNLTASSGKFTGTVYAGNIAYNGDADGHGPEAGRLSGSGIIEGSVGGSRIKDNAISYAKAASGVQTSLDYADFSNDALHDLALSKICCSSFRYGNNVSNAKQFKPTIISFVDGMGNTRSWNVLAEITD